MTDQPPESDAEVCTRSCEVNVRCRVYVRGPGDLHYLIVEAAEPIEATERLNGAASSTNPFVKLGGQSSRAAEVVVVVEEVDRSDR